MGKKVKVVFDTNVWISIFLKKTLSKEFSELFQKEKIEVYTTEEIVKEISRTLMYPRIYEILELSGINERAVIQRISENSILVQPKFRSKIIKEDPEDNKVLDCALQAKAGFIVSGDKHLLALGKFRNVKIITPRELLDILK